MTNANDLHILAQMNKLSGLKNTPSRLAILSVLKDEERPLNALEIFELVSHKADLATVYRTLETFCDNGLINKLEFGEGKFRYEIKKKHHHHLICTECGKIEDVEGEFMKKMEEEIYKDKQFKVKYHSLEFFGVCKDCLSEQN